MPNFPFDPLGFMKPDKLLSWDGIMSRGAYEACKEEVPVPNTALHDQKNICRNQKSIFHVKLGPALQKILNADAMLSFCKTYQGVIAHIGLESTGIYGFYSNNSSITLIESWYGNQQPWQQYAIAQEIKKQFLDCGTYVKTKIPLEISSERSEDSDTIELRRL